MRISEDRLQLMFKFAGIKKSILHNALLQMGRKHLKSKLFKDNWSEDNPTKNYCYVIAEFVYYYLAPKGSKPYKLANIPGDDGLHRFVKWPDGTIVDLAVDQFPNYEDVNYENAKVCYFMQTGVKGPSKRTRLLADLCDIKLPTEKQNTLKKDIFWD